MVFDVFSCYFMRVWNGNFRFFMGIDIFGYVFWDFIFVFFIDCLFEFWSVVGWGWILVCIVGRWKEFCYYVLSFFWGSLLLVVKWDVLCIWNLWNWCVWEEMLFVMGEWNLLLLCLLLFMVFGRVEGVIVFCK